MINFQNFDKETPIKYVLDEFADIKILRYIIPNWQNLNLKEKKYIYFLSEAAKCGRDILYDQNFKYNLIIRKSIENIINTYNGDKNCNDYKNFLIYAKRIFFSNGIHHHYSEDKIPTNFSAKYLNELITNSLSTGFCINGNQSLNDFSNWLAEIICNPETYKIKRCNDSSKDIIKESSMNFYEGLTSEEAKKYYSDLENADKNCRISHGLNSKLIKKDGKIYEEKYKINGLYGKAIEKIVYFLEQAMQVAENEEQKNYTKLLIDFYKTGDLEKFDDYNIAWVKEKKSKIDYINGFIENYGDPIGIKATWEAVVEINDEETAEISEKICQNAQWFENNAPINSKFKKSQTKGVSAKAIAVAQVGGDCFPTPPIGINLPNADWLRKEHGSKSVTITNLLKAYEEAKKESPNSMMKEFYFSDKERSIAEKYGYTGNFLHTILHECLGHASGQLNDNVSPNALAENASTLEEARADLFALYYMPDKKIDELNIIENYELTAKSEYYSYILNGLFTQFVRIEKGKKNMEAHMQARKLIAEWCFEKGKNENIIENKIIDNKNYFIINDYEKLRHLFGTLLAEIQRIKSEGDYLAGKNLVEKYAINIDPKLHEEVLERYSKLNLKAYSGFVNPDIIAIKEGDEIKDIVVEYPNDFLEQHLKYGKNYSFL